MTPPLLVLQNIDLTLGATPLLAGAELAVGPGDRVCLVGRNGSGKSTLLRIAAGLIPFDAGRRFVQPDATISYLQQEPDMAGFATVEDYVAAGLGPGDDLHYGRSLLAALGLTGAEHPARLSGGEARRAAIARALAPAPDVLLPDEPTNHLDLPAIAWLEQELAGSRSGIITISHDRRLLETLSDSVIWLEDGITRRLDRGFSHFEAWRDQVLEQEETERHKLGRRIAMEEDWLRYGVTARRKRNQRRLAALHDLRRARREGRPSGASLRLAATEADRSGRLIAVAEGVSKSWGDRTVVRDFSAKLLRGDRVGIVGANGAGKTTLLRLLTGELAPDRGTVTLGASLAMVMLDQQRATLDPAATLADTLTGGGGGDAVQVGTQKRHVMSYMKDFLFRAEQARTPAGDLSGGERGRLMLALAFARPSNLMVLDEPTNDLDLETLDLLQELFGDYQGTVLLVSHDRDFLDHVCTSVIAAADDGRWIEYAGGYSDMLAQGGAVPVARQAPRTPARPTAPAPRDAGAGPSPPDRPRMAYKDRHALETLPREIETLQARAAKLRALMSTPDFFSRGQALFAQASAELAATDAALAVAEDRWLELELMREQLDV